MKAPKTRLFLILISLTAIALAVNFLNSDDDYVTLKGEIFSTHYLIKYQTSATSKLNPQEIQTAIDKELARIDWMASSWKDESEISRYNRAEKKEDFPISDELKSLIHRSREIEQLTDGAFNIEYQKGKLDISGITEGYAMESIAAYLTEDLGITSFLVDIGGEVKAKGVNPKGEAWSVGIFIPPSHQHIVTPKIALNNTSIATSGTYFKGNHIIDPLTGNAVSNSLISASVIHASTTIADALATALFVMGSEKGLAWANKNKVQAIFILQNGTILYSDK